LSPRVILDSSVAHRHLHTFPIRRSSDLGGILKYLEEVPSEQSKCRGECFVFDNRVTVRHDLAPGTFDQRHACRHPVSAEDMASPQYEQGVSCPHCYDSLPEKTRRRAEARQRQTELAKRRNQPHPIGLAPELASPNAR